MRPAGRLFMSLRFQHILAVAQFIKTATEFADAGRQSLSHRLLRGVELMFKGVHMVGQLFHPVTYLHEKAILGARLRGGGGGCFDRWLRRGCCRQGSDRSRRQGGGLRLCWLHGDIQ